VPGFQSAETTHRRVFECDDRMELLGSIFDGMAATFGGCATASFHFS